MASKIAYKASVTGDLGRMDKPEARRALGLPLDRPVAVTLGIVSPTKRIGKILEALAAYMGYVPTPPPADAGLVGAQWVNRGLGLHAIGEALDHFRGERGAGGVQQRAPEEKTPPGASGRGKDPLHRDHRAQLRHAVGVHRHLRAV